MRAFVDANGNVNDSPFSWSFTAKEAACGRAELSGAGDRTLVINSQTPLLNGTVPVAIYNPDQETQAWVDNHRTQSFSLLYRKQGASVWSTGVTANGTSVDFFDDVCDQPLPCQTYLVYFV